MATATSQLGPVDRVDLPEGTLLAWALERRRFFPVEHAYQLAGHLPRTRVELIGESGPFVTENRPDAVATLIRSFVAGHDHPAGAVA